MLQDENFWLRFWGVRGSLAPLPIRKVNAFEEKLILEIRAEGQDILETIRTEKELTGETEERLKAFLDKFSATFV